MEYEYSCSPPNFLVHLCHMQNDLVTCSTWYWVLTVAQFPATLAVFGYECVKLYKESKKRRSLGNTESVCEATINWTVPNLIFCALCGILGGTVGGLLGSGGGFILGPLLLEIGVIPQVASATATFVMMFSSSLSVVEFYLLKRFPIPYGIFLVSKANNMVVSGCVTGQNLFV
ncbi:putative transmembrane protein TauE [Helianthus annuus]|nr:putative transmembrane protein TauE [Helianthus annuus]